MMTFKLMRKDYLYLASCLVPIGDQIHMSQQEIADMLRTKTRRFSEEEIARKWPGLKQRHTFAWSGQLAWIVHRVGSALGSLVPGKHAAAGIEKTK